MQDFILRLDDEQTAYLKSMDTQSLIDDLESVIILIDEMDIEDDDVIFY